MRRGRPRSAAADEEIFRAAGEVLLERGYDQLTIDEVARRAGTGKTTIYRRYRDRSELVRAFVDHIFRDSPLPEARGDIEQVGREIVRMTNAFYQSETGKVLMALVPVLGREPVLGPSALSAIAARRTRLARIMREAMAGTGSLSDGEASAALDLLIGAVVYGIWFRRRPLSEAEVAFVGQIVARGLARRTSRRSPR
jgi:AcrR family transcriptional regulator